MFSFWVCFENDNKFLGSIILTDAAFAFLFLILYSISNFRHIYLLSAELMCRKMKFSVRISIYWFLIRLSESIGVRT